MAILPKQATVAVATAVSCMVLFCVPMVLRYRVYSEAQLSLTSGDLVIVDQRVSSVWCSAQTLRTLANSSFSVFHLPNKASEPLPGQQTQHETYALHADLRVGGMEYWAFYLHPGSKMNLSTCARLPGATLTVIKGPLHMEECLRTFRDRTEQDSSEESEESEEDDENAPSSSISSSEGVITSEATDEGAFHCPEFSTMQQDLKEHLSCSADIVRTGSDLRYLDNFNLEVEEMDYYYLVFSAGNILDIMSNQVHWSLDLERTYPDLSSSLDNCSSIEQKDKQCLVPLAFASSETCYVKLDLVTNGSRTPLTDIIESSCEPRKALYFVFFLFIFLAIGFCAFQ